ncbi:MAG: hypothetical protein JNG89_19540, partial [Planctomycetaceae bacterium]|nr:hypothetical protein [Planctomycetaceae bacterium]
HNGGETTLVLPLPETTSGRLGTIRIGGDLALRESESWELPTVHLQGALPFSILRRVHVERPLTLLSFDPRDMRQTGINVEERSGTWMFEDLSHHASLTVQIGRPPASVSLRGLTLIDFAQPEARFQSVVSLLSRGENIYRARLRMPADWSVVDVGVPTGQAAAVTSWRIIDGELDSQLEIDFRQALSSQSPRQVLISGRCVDAQPGARTIKPFPRLGADEEARVMLAIRGAALDGANLTPHGGLRLLTAGDTTPEWTALGSALGVPVGDPQLSWFVDTGAGAEASVSAASASASTAPAGTNDAGDSAADFTSDLPLQLDVRLESSVGSRGTEWHRHLAVFLLSGKRPESPPKIRLAAGIQLDGVFVDGQPQSVVSANDAIELLDWPESPRRVEFRYRSRVTEDSGWLSRSLQVPLPEWDTPPRELEWRLHLPRTERLAELRVPRSTVAPRPETGWTLRLFGPLARENWLAGINPFSRAAPRRPSPLNEGAGVVTIGVLSPEPVLSLELADIPNSQRTGWFSMFGACLVVCVLRLGTARGRIAACCAAIAIALAAVALPDTQSVLWGGALMGTLLGILLPQSWLKARPAVAMRLEGSSLRSAGAGAAAGVSVMLAFLLTSGLPAQTPDAKEPSPPASEAATPPEFDVLIPMQGNEQAGDVWIQRRLLPAFDAWHGTQRRNPPWLLRSSRYRFQQGSAPRLHAEFDVAVFDRRPQVMLDLPFGRLWVADPDACRINAEPAQIRPSADSGSLLVALPGAPPDVEEIPTVNVSLELQPSAASRVGGGWEFDVPPVLDAQLSLPPDGEPETTLSTWSQRGPETNDEGQRVFDLGAASVLSLQPAPEQTPSAAARWSFDAMSLVEVHPLRLRIRTQLTTVAAPQTGSGSASQRLRLLLPGQAEVPVVAVEGLRSYSVRHPRPETTLLELELDRRLPADTAIHLDFTLPARMTGTQVVIPALAFFDGGQLRSHRIGLRAAAGMDLLPPASTTLPAELREMPIAVMFSAGLSNNSTWPVPSHVYLAAQPAPITASLSAIQPVRSATLEQSLNVGDGLLHWQATAIVDVPVLPVFKHDFRLASDVRLDSVEVEQDGASRLLNWSRHDDHLVLYLPGDRTGRQELRLAGVMPFKAATVTPLPAFSLLDATITASELIIQSPQARRLDLIAADGAVLSTGTATSTDAGFIRRFSQQDAVLPVAFRSEPAPAPLSVAVVASIAGDDSGWRWNTAFHLDRPLTAGEFLIVGMPRELAGSVAPDRSTIATPDGEAGEVLRLLLHSPGDASRTSLGFSTQLVIPDRGDWMAPRIELLNATVSEQIVVVPAEFPFVPSSSAAAVEAEGWPAALREAASPGPGATAYRFADGEPRFSERQATVGAPIVKLVESAIWPGQDGSTAGTTTFWVVAGESRCELQLPWPGTASLVRLLWDDHLLEASQGADEVLRCRIDGLSPRSIHRLSLEWTSAAGAFTNARGELWRPHWTQSPPAPEIAALFPRDGYRLYSQGMLGGRPDALQQRAAALLGMYDAASTGDRQLLAADIESTVSALQSHSSASAEQLEARWSELQEPAEEAPVESSATDSRAHFVVATAIRDAEALLIAVPDGAASLHLRELHAGSTLAAVLVLVLLSIVLLARFRRGWSRAITQLPVNADALSVALLGVVWWLWLKLSVVGLVLLVVAAVLQWRSVRRPAPQSLVQEA